MTALPTCGLAVPTTVVARSTTTELSGHAKNQIFLPFLGNGTLNSYSIA